MLNTCDVVGGKARYATCTQGPPTIPATGKLFSMKSFAGGNCSGAGAIVYYGAGKCYKDVQGGFISVTCN
jgi:hypothetical protein